MVLPFPAFTPPQTTGRPTQGMRHYWSKRTDPVAVEKYTQARRILLIEASLSTT
ncbi:MAG: hypothetical protein R3C68_04100 [Myxococcota bacterium]